MAERLRARLRRLALEHSERVTAGAPLCYKCDHRTEPGGLAWAAGPDGCDVLVCPRCIWFHKIQGLLRFADPDSPPHAAAVTVLGRVFGGLANALTQRSFRPPPRQLPPGRAVPCSFCGFDVALHATGSPGDTVVTVCRACWLLQMSRALTRHVSAASGMLPRAAQLLEECHGLLFTAPFRASRVPPGLSADEIFALSTWTPLQWLALGEHIDGGPLPGPARLFSTRNDPTARAGAPEPLSPRTDDESEFWLDL